VKTTKTHFDIFKRECRYWIRRFGLGDWCVEFFHEQWEGENMAGCAANLSGAVASLCLYRDWKDIAVTNSEIKRIAFHEVCELLVVRLEILAGARFVTKNEIIEARHGIIRRLENAFYEDTR